MTPVAQIAETQAQVKGISNDKNQNGGYLGRRVSKIGAIKQPAGARSVPVMICLHMVYMHKNPLSLGFVHFLLSYSEFNLNSMVA